MTPQKRAELKHLAERKGKTVGELLDEYTFRFHGNSHTLDGE